MLKRIIQTLIGTILGIQLLLIVLTIAHNYDSVELNVPFIAYLISGRPEIVYELVHSTVNTALILWFVSKGLFVDFDGHSLPKAFERIGKIGLKAALISSLALPIASRIILGHYLFACDFLPWMVLWFLNTLYLDAYGPVFNPLDPKNMFYNFITYSEGEESMKGEM